MYPRGELETLALRKEYLRLRIAVRREECALAAAELARPVAWIDHGLERWRQISPFTKLVGLPAVIFVARALIRRFGHGKWAWFARLAPMVFQVTRAFIRQRHAGAEPVG